MAPINCDKQEREKKTNQSRTVKSCIAALQARHGLPTSLMECTTVEWNFNQSHICQCPLAFHVLKASVVLFVRYCDQDEWRGVGGLPLVDMSWLTVHREWHMYRLQSAGGKYAPQPARNKWGNGYKNSVSCIPWKTLSTGGSCFLQIQWHSVQKTKFWKTLFFKNYAGVTSNLTRYPLNCLSSMWQFWKLTFTGKSPYTYSNIFVTQK